MDADLTPYDWADVYGPLELQNEEVLASYDRTAELGPPETPTAKHLGPCPSCGLDIVLTDDGRFPCSWCGGSLVDA